MTNTQRAILEGKKENLIALYRRLDNRRVQAVLMKDINKINDLLTK